MNIHKILFSACVSLLLAGDVLGVTVFLKTRSEPLRGFYVGESEETITVGVPQQDGSVIQRHILLSQVEDVLHSIDRERLALLKPDQPDAYREYAEELAEKRVDPEARQMAIRLFLIAAYHDQERLGESCLLGMVALARSPEEERRFRAMVYLLDPQHDRRKLVTQPTSATKTGGNDGTPAESNAGARRYFAKALQYARAGDRRTALGVARKSGVQQEFDRYRQLISFAEFEKVCLTARKCTVCENGKIPCPTCKGNGQGCRQCFGNGVFICTECDGNYLRPGLPKGLLRQVLATELALLSSTPTQGETANAKSWSQTVLTKSTQPVVPLRLETITEFDPRAAVYRDGKWVKAAQ